MLSAGFWTRLNICLISPRIGRVVPEFDDPAIRELIVQKYRIIYRVTDHSVTIAAVIHGARLLPNAFHGRRL